MDSNDWESLERYRPASNDFIDWLKTFGPMEIYGADPEEFDPNNFDSNLIWTESWRVKRLVSSGFEESSDSHRAITNYFVSTKPWLADSAPIEILAEGMVPCEKCKEVDEKESCVECDGEGEYLVDFCELIF